MRLGMHLRELWDHKLGFALVLVIALLAAGRTYGGDGFPPGLGGGSPETARATTHVLVDTPQSSVVDLREDTYDLEGLTNRALLVSNSMASLPVREQIAAHAGVAAAAIQISTPLDAQYPQSTAESAGSPAGLGSGPGYRLDVLANVTVPVIDIASEAPSEAAARKLADGAAEGLASYLGTVATTDSTPVAARIHLIQLGRAQVVPIEEGAGPVISIIVFLIVFALASATVLLVTRVRSGWSAAGDDLDDAAARGAF